MGTQQFLILAIGIVTVGIAVALGINIVTESYADRISEDVIRIVYDIGMKANVYRMNPIELGGGGGSYKGFDSKISEILRNESIEKLKVKDKKKRLDFSFNLKDGKKKPTKVEARFDPDGINRLRFYDPDEKKWVWLVKDKGKKDKKDKKDKK